MKGNLKKSLIAGASAAAAVPAVLLGHLEENTAVRDIELDDDTKRELDAAT